MLLDTVIIILREVLEASLLAGLLLAISQMSGLGKRWLIGSLVFGLSGAAVYATNLNWISEQFDYRGQELTNSLLQIMIFLLAANVIARSHMVQLGKPGAPGLRIAMGAVIALAIVREFSEILLYLQGFANNQGQLYSVLAGSIIGAAIGLSIGIVFYYGFTLRSGNRSLHLCLLTLMFVVAGIVAQVAPMLQQIDLLPATNPVWDSSRLLTEDSITGQLLYAVLGYEATPSPWHLAFYLFAFVCLASLRFVSRTRS